jgi:hypothetical protein
VPLSSNPVFNILVLLLLPLVPTTACRDRRRRHHHRHHGRGGFPGRKRGDRRRKLHWRLRSGQQPHHSRRRGQLAHRNSNTQRRRRCLCPSSGAERAGQFSLRRSQSRLTLRKALANVAHTLNRRNLRGLCEQAEEVDGKSGRGKLVSPGVGQLKPAIVDKRPRVGKRRQCRGRRRGSGGHRTGLSSQPRRIGNRRRRRELGQRGCLCRGCLIAIHRRRIVHPHVLVLGFGFGDSRKVSAQSVSRQQLCQLDAVGADF